MFSNAVNSESDPCHYKHHIDSTKSPLISAVMFGAGIFGNVAALVILEIRRRRDVRTGGTRRRALFHVLITSLVVTDLAGTCLISPLVQLSYSRNTTLVGMSHNTNGVCKYFGFSMTFFSLVTLSLLFTMALERCLAIGYPYLYSRHVSRKCAYITIPLVVVLSTLFCLLPFLKFGKYVQYCPGTWCFIDMNPLETKDRVYANLYATIMLVLVLAIVLCNGFVVYQLFKMYRRRRRNGGSMMATTRSNNDRRAMSMAEEVEHLILLVFMTIIFIICTLPCCGCHILLCSALIFPQNDHISLSADISICGPYGSDCPPFHLRQLHHRPLGLHPPLPQRAPLLLGLGLPCPPFSKCERCMTIAVHDHSSISWWASPTMHCSFPATSSISATDGRRLSRQESKEMHSQMYM